MGLEVSAENVRVIALGATTLGSAVVTVEDPSFAKVACAKLRTASDISRISATAISATMPRRFGLHRVDCRKVLCF